MVVIYMMMYGKSQKANYFQVALSRTLQQFGIAEQGLASLRNLGTPAQFRQKLNFLLLPIWIMLTFSLKKQLQISNW